MKSTILTAALLLASSSLAPASTIASGVIASLVFTTPTGNVGPSDSIPILVTLTLDPNSAPITTDAGYMVTSGYSSSDVTANLLPNLPAYVNVDTDSLRANLTEFLSCSGSFFSGCNENPYHFDFDYSSNAFVTQQNLNLVPGSSTTFTYGSLTPTGGVPVAPGTYNLGPVGYFIQIYDNSGPGGYANADHIADIAIADTSLSESTFSRTVISSAPEPGTYAMMGSALVGLLYTVRRRR